MALTYAWNNITAGMVDSDSPINQVLMDDIRENLIHNYEYIGGVTYTPAEDHDHDGVNSALTKLTSEVSPYPMGPADFLPQNDTYDWILTRAGVWGPGSVLYNRVALTPQTFYAAICLPDAAVMTSFKLFGYKNSAAGALLGNLYRHDRQGTNSTLATVTAPNWAGWGNVEDVTIATATIDNVNYAYTVEVTIDPDAAVTDHAFSGILIAWNF